MGDDKQPPQPNPWVKNALIWTAILLSMLMVASMFSAGGTATGQTIPYSEFKNRVAAGEVAKVEISDTRITGEMDGGELFQTIPVRDGELNKLLTDNGVVFSGRPVEQGNMWVVLLVNILPFVLLLGLGFFIFRQVQKNNGGGAMGFGKSKAKLLTERQGRVTFDDVAGIEEARDEL
ncbi:MAG: ATP-dependent metallopeptidase FtsH/Yme1/Tma family protein, partial [Sphingopyxis sp.]|nr:ATP-dependent metallopeptidase FtsH/Yme1/Tma family protein [Sphingopyxis sp.]